MVRRDFVQDVNVMLKLKTFIREEVRQIAQHIVKVVQLNKQWKEIEKLNHK